MAITLQRQRSQLRQRYSSCSVAALAQTLDRLDGDAILAITAHAAPHVNGEAEGRFTDLTVDKLAGLLKKPAPDSWSGDGLAFARNLKRRSPPEAVRRPTCPGTSRPEYSAGHPEAAEPTDGAGGLFYIGFTFRAGIDEAAGSRRLYRTTGFPQEPPP